MTLKKLSLVENQKRKRTNEQQHTRITDRNVPKNRKHFEVSIKF